MLCCSLLLTAWNPGEIDSLKKHMRWTLANISGVDDGWVMGGWWVDDGWVMGGWWVGDGWMMGGWWVGDGWVMGGWWVGDGWVMGGWWVGDGWVMGGWWVDDGWVMGGWWVDDGWMMGGWWVDELSPWQPEWSRMCGRCWVSHHLLCFCETERSDFSDAPCHRRVESCYIWGHDIIQLLNNKQTNNWDCLLTSSWDCLLTNNWDCLLTSSWDCLLTNSWDCLLTNRQAAETVY